MPWWWPTTSDVYKVAFATQQRVEQLHQKVDRLEAELDTLRGDFLTALAEGVSQMATELEALRAAVEANNQRGDELIANLTATIDRLNAMVGTATELAALKAGVLEEVSKIQEQVAQFESAPPLPPAE